MHFTEQSRRNVKKKSSFTLLKKTGRCYSHVKVLLVFSLELILDIPLIINKTCRLKSSFFILKTLCCDSSVCTILQIKVIDILMGFFLCGNLCDLCLTTKVNYGAGLECGRSWVRASSVVDRGFEPRVW